MNRCPKCNARMIKVEVERGGSVRKLGFCPECGAGYEDLGNWMTPWGLMSIKIWNRAFSEEEIKKLMHKKRLSRSTSVDLAFDGVDDEVV